MNYFFVLNSPSHKMILLPVHKTSFATRGHLPMFRYFQTFLYLRSGKSRESCKSEGRDPRK